MLQRKRVRYSRMIQRIDSVPESTTEDEDAGEHGSVRIVKHTLNNDNVDDEVKLHLLFSETLNCMAH